MIPTNNLILQRSEGNTRYLNIEISDNIAQQPVKGIRINNKQVNIRGYGPTRSPQNVSQFMSIQKTFQGLLNPTSIIHK